MYLVFTSQRNQENRKVDDGCYFLNCHALSLKLTGIDFLAYVFQAYGVRWTVVRQTTDKSDTGLYTALLFNLFWFWLFMIFFKDEVCRPNNLLGMVQTQILGWKAKPLTSVCSETQGTQLKT